MCDILICVLLSMRIAKMARAKGRNPVGYVLLLIALFVGGEISGIIAGVIIGMGAAGANGEPETMFVVLGAIAGIVIGSLVAFGILGALPDLRDEFPLRDRDDDHDWRDHDYKRRFDAGGSKRNDYTDDPRDRPRSEDDRYKAE